MKKIDRLITIRNLAYEQRHEDGYVEFDVNAKVSESHDNGAYVRAWIWVDFSGTELDKEKAD